MIGAILFGALVALQVGDGVSTIVALRSPDLGEGNPVAAKLFDKMGIVPGVMLLKVLGITLAAWVYFGPMHPQLRVAALAIACGFYAWAVADNVRLIIKRRRSDV